MLTVDAVNEDFSVRSSSANLWLQYVKYVQILLDFICAECLSNWELHLKSLSCMLNMFAAMGHQHYAQSAHQYLQLMLDLPTMHSWLQEQRSSKCMYTDRLSD